MRYRNILVIYLLCFSFISIFGEEGKEDKTEKAINDFMTKIETGPLELSKAVRTENKLDMSKLKTEIKKLLDQQPELKDKFQKWL